MSIYSFSDDMKRVDVPCNHAKNNLEIGRVLHLNGYNDHDYIIVKNFGVSEYSQKYGYGARYLLVNLDDFGQHQKKAYTLKDISEQKDESIQTYIMDEIKTPDEVLDIWKKSESKRIEKEQSQKKTETEIVKLFEKGKELFRRYIPENAKALIIAEQERDESDLMTDYFATSTSQTVILGWSTHTRNIFSEMRKHAGKIEETKHLAIAPDVNSNGHKKTEENKSWWHPSNEHRENSSMGHGNYLKASGRYDSGWVVRKCYYKPGVESHYLSLGKRCIFANDDYDETKLK